MAQERVFLAGAAGAIGARLTPLLVKAGYAVFGTTRDPRKAALIEANGAMPVIVDVFDADALRAEVAKVQPHAVVHQLTDLPPGLDKSRMAEAVVRNAAIRTKGTRNLVNAALEAGCTAPVGALAEVAEGDAGPEVFLRANVTALDGNDAVRLSATGPTTDAEDVGRRLAADLLAEGADQLMGAQS